MLLWTTRQLAAPDFATKDCPIPHPLHCHSVELIAKMFDKIIFVHKPPTPPQPTPPTTPAPKSPKKKNIFLIKILVACLA